MAFVIFTRPSNTEACVEIMMSRAIPDYERTIKKTSNGGYPQALLPFHIQGTFSDRLANWLRWNSDYENRDKAFRLFEKRMEEYIFNDRQTKVTVQAVNFVGGDWMSEPLWGWVVEEVEGYKAPRVHRTSVRDYIRRVWPNLGEMIDTVRYMFSK